ncbi:MAG: hypothetical protein QM737_18865 [Ferruginibacter sp.]
MEQNKNRYELILGFVTLIISFSAFKDELKAINVNLGFYSFTLADYLLKVVYGFSLCLYLYILEKIARQSKRINSWKIVNFIEQFAFIIFVFIILSPIILLLVYFFYKGFNNYSKLSSQAKEVLASLFTTLLGFIGGLVSTFVAWKYSKAKDKSRQEEIEKEEIVELESALKLYSSEFYSQSILEAFKVLETHFIKLFAKRGIKVQRNQFNFSELFKEAIKLELLDDDDIATIKEIRQMRNSAAHLDITHTKEQATKTIEFIKYLLNKTSINQ